MTLIIRNLISVIVMSCISGLLYANSLHFLEYSINDFPEVSAKLFYLNSNSVPIQNMTKDDFQINSNGINIAPTNIIAPEQNTYENLSLLISVDLALNSKMGEQTNIDLASEFLDNLIELIDFEKNELALTSFDWFSYLNTEYTNEKQTIDEQLSLLKASSGSRLDVGLLDDPAGALKIAANSQFKSSILFITEGGNISGLTEAIEFAKNNDIAVNVISFEKTISLDLKTIAEETGGFYFDNIVNQYKMSNFAEIIKNYLWNYKPFTIKWISEIFCDDIYSNTIKALKDDLSVDFSFIAPSRLKPMLVCNPNYLRFSAVQPTQSKELFVYLKALNGDIVIKRYTTDDIRFQVLEGALAPGEEVTLKDGDSIEISIVYTPSDSSVIFSKLNINSTACLGNEIIMTGGFPNTPPLERTLNLEFPNCAEKLIAGDSARIIWSGLLPDDIIQLEWSKDAGASWDTLSIDVTGLEYLWQVPDVESDECLIRAIQLWPNNIGETKNLYHSGAVNCANFNPKDGNYIVSASSDKIARVWNSNSGIELMKLKGHSKSVVWAEFNQQETQIVTASEDSTAKLWSFPDGDLIRTFKKHNDVVTSAAFSPDGLLLATSSWDETVIIWEISTGRIIHNINCQQGKLWHVAFNKFGTEIITAGSSGKAKLWNVNTGALIQVYDANKSNEIISYASFSPDDSRIVTASWYGVASVWDKAKADTIFTITHKDESGGLIPLYSAGFYTRASELVLLTSGIDHARIWNGNTGELKAVLSEHFNSVPFVTMNFDGSRILTSSWDSTAKIWNLDKRDLQMDTTDCLFSIVKQKAEAYSFDLGSVQVNTAFDTTLNVFLENLSSFAYPIKSIRIEGTNANEFQILKIENANMLDSLEKKGVKIRFTPLQSGERSCYIEIVFSQFSLKAEIKADAYNLPLYIKNSRINFGTVELGEFKDTLITAAIKNISIKSITCSSIKLKGPDDNHFDILYSFEPFTLLPNEEKDITFRFNPESIGRKNGVISFIHNADGGESMLYLYGEGIEPSIDTVSISIGECSAAPGDIINIPVSFKKHSQNVLSENFKSIKAELSFNASLLEPLSEIQKDIIVNNVRTITLDIPVSNEDYNYEIKFKAALGNDTLSVLKLNNVFPVANTKVVINFESGIFYLTDLCKEGGIRLFDANNRLNLSQNKPNPFENETSIDFEILEEGIYSLIILDETGKTIKTIFEQKLAPAKYSFNINCYDLPSGSFFYMLKTPSQMVLKRMVISK